MTALELRAQKGKEIAENFGAVTRLDETCYKVASQRTREIYQIDSTERGWICNCPDHRFRGVKCKHIWAVEYSFQIRRLVKKETIIPVLNAQACRFCGSEKIIKKSIRHNKYGDLQRYLCKTCGKRFVINLGFEKMHASPQAITGAMQLYFTGESFRNVQRFLKLQGVNVVHQTVYNWIQKYVGLMNKYVEQLQPQVGNAWRTDELYLKVKGDMKYLFALMDDETRFWISQQVSEHKGTSDVKPMFREGQRIAGKNPTAIISDGAYNFAEATTGVFWNRNLPRSEQVKHIRDITFDGERHNNKMERMNGEIRDREKTMRGIKKTNSPILTGYQIFRNFVRPHEALEGKTPSEAAGIKVEGENKFLTLIQNASRGPTLDREI